MELPLKHLSHLSFFLKSKWDFKNLDKFFRQSINYSFKNKDSKKDMQMATVNKDGVSVSAQDAQQQIFSVWSNYQLISVHSSSFIRVIDNVPI